MVGGMGSLGLVISGMVPWVVITVSGPSTTFLLNTFSDVVKYWGPTPPSCYSIDRVGRLTCQTHQTVALSCFFMGITLTQSSLVISTCLSPCSKRAIFCLTPDSPTIPSSFSSKPHSLTHRFPYWPLRWSPRCGTPKALYSQTFHSYSITKPFHSYPGQKAGCRPTVWFRSFGKLFSVCRWVYAFWNV